MPTIDNKLRLVLVTKLQVSEIEQYLQFVCRCVKYGVTCVQLRAKNIDVETFVEIGQLFLSCLRKLDIPLIINDNIYVCKNIDADGVHIGQTDMHATEARKQLGPNKIIGLSVCNEEQLFSSQNLPIDYIGIGPIFQTSNKPEVSAIGMETFVKLAKLSRHPVVAIGGITEDNANNIFACGAQGVACINCLHTSKHLDQTIQKLNSSANNDHGKLKLW
ncbi:thiamine phosphate synthase [Candidatus Ichthyocystis hellenicum]|uniref:thiamine phosphate synthase n=1 Tax=Candidatus Ichthyocystis hellenicum TaxID=1561003 RepID=UPI000A6E9F09|nr:thiamine phosphate synthase [Candidatus Ichthyocystis hellenicum]